MGRKLLFAALVPLVAACSGSDKNLSRLNPINWIGSKDKEEMTAEVEVAEVEETQQLVLEVVDLRMDPLPDGAILLASGLPSTQGYSNGELVPLNDEMPEEGTLIYEFRVSAPAQLSDEGTPVSREVIALRTITSQRLAGVRQILVLAQSNSRSILVGE